MAEFDIDTTETGTEQKTYLNQKDFDEYQATQNANADAPAKNTPADDTPTTSQTDTNQFDLNQYIEKEFGVKPEELKTRVSQYETLAQEKERLNQELEALKNKPSYLTETGKRVDEYLSKNVPLTTILKFDGLNVDALTPEQRVKLQLEVQNPAWKPEHIEAYYNSKYATDPDAIDPSQNLLKEAQLLADDKAAQEHLKQYVMEKLNPAPMADPNVAAQQKVQALQSQWQGQMPALTNAMPELKYEVTAKAWGSKGEEDKASAFALPLSEQDRSVIWNAAVNSAISSGLAPTAESIAHVKELANKIAWSTHGPAMLENALKNQAQSLIRSFKQTINNPAAVGDATNRQTGPVEKTREDFWREK